MNGLYLIKISPRSYFGTFLTGDTLFGNFCWTLRYSMGADVLAKLLSQYTERPFVVFSDPFPEGYLPRPALPMAYQSIPTKNPDNTEAETETALSSSKKTTAKKIWCPVKNLNSGFS